MRQAWQAQEPQQWDAEPGNVQGTIIYPTRRRFFFSIIILSFISNTVILSTCFYVVHTHHALLLLLVVIRNPLVEVGSGDADSKSSMAI
jgi:hypothetical protein